MWLVISAIFSKIKDFRGHSQSLTVATGWGARGACSPGGTVQGVAFQGAIKD